MRLAAALPHYESLAPYALPHYRPVTANHMPPGDVTKMIGAKQGLGRSMVASMSASPSGMVAGKLSVLLVKVVGLPLLSMLRQLTKARKFATGFRPVAANTSPLTCTSRVPSAPSSPWALEIVQGAPAPLTPWMGLPGWPRGVTKGPDTPTIVSNSIIFDWSDSLGTDASCRADRVTNATKPRDKMILLINHLSWRFAVEQCITFSGCLETVSEAVIRWPIQEPLVDWSG